MGGRGRGVGPTKRAPADGEQQQQRIDVQISLNSLKNSIKKNKEATWGIHSWQKGSGVNCTKKHPAAAVEETVGTQTFTRCKKGKTTPINSRRKRPQERR